MGYTVTYVVFKGGDTVTAGRRAENMHVNNIP